MKKFIYHSEGADIGVDTNPVVTQTQFRIDCYTRSTLLLKGDFGGGSVRVLITTMCSTDPEDGVELQSVNSDDLIELPVGYMVTLDGSAVADVHVCVGGIGQA